MTKILNLARLDRKLKRLPEAPKTQIRAAMEKTAEDIVAMMKRLAPKNTHQLEESIGWTWGKAPDGAGIVSTIKSQLGADLTITIYAGSKEVYWARFQEFGTQDQPASPFFYVSWRANKKTAKRKVRAAVRKAAKQAVNG